VSAVNTEVFHNGPISGLANKKRGEFEESSCNISEQVSRQLSEMNRFSLKIKKKTERRSAARSKLSSYNKR